MAPSDFDFYLKKYLKIHIRRAKFLGFDRSLSAPRKRVKKDKPKSAQYGLRFLLPLGSQLLFAVNQHYYFGNPAIHCLFQVIRNHSDAENCTHQIYMDGETRASGGRVVGSTGKAGKHLVLILIEHDPRSENG